MRFRIRIQEYAINLFSDEFRFHLDNSDSRWGVHRRVRRGYQDDRIVHLRRFGEETARGSIPLQIVEYNLFSLHYND